MRFGNIITMYEKKEYYYSSKIDVKYNWIVNIKFVYWVYAQTLKIQYPRYKEVLQKFAEAGDQSNQDGASVHAQARSRITFLPETANFDASAFERINVQRLRVLGFCVSNEDCK